MVSLQDEPGLRRIPEKNVCDDDGDDVTVATSNYLLFALFFCISEVTRFFDFFTLLLFSKSTPSLSRLLSLTSPKGEMFVWLDKNRYKVPSMYHLTSVTYVANVPCMMKSRYRVLCFQYAFSLHLIILIFIIGGLTFVPLGDGKRSSTRDQSIGCTGMKTVTSQFPWQ